MNCTKIKMSYILKAPKLALKIMNDFRDKTRPPFFPYLHYSVLFRIFHTTVDDGIQCQLFQSFQIGSARHDTNKGFVEVVAQSSGTPEAWIIVRHNNRKIQREEITRRMISEIFHQLENLIGNRTHFDRYLLLLDQLH